MTQSFEEQMFDDEGDQSKIFPLNNSKLHLRYKGWLDCPKMLQHFKSIFELNDRFIEYWSFKKDIGPKTGFKHTHVMLMCKNKRFRNRNVSQFIYEGVTPYIVKIQTDIHLFNVIRYHKEKTDGEPPWGSYPDIDLNLGLISTKTVKKETLKGIKNEPLEKVKYQAYQCKSEQELMESFQEEALASDWTTIKSIWKSRPKEPKPPEPSTEDWYLWKKQRLEETRLPADDSCRKIVFFVDIYGNSGKTSLRKHFIRHIEGTILLTPSSMYHISTIIEDKLASGDTCKHIIFDLEADTKVSPTWYASLESLKSGMFTSQKYRGKEIDIGTPHITIFSNSLPQIEKLIVDRWDIRFLGIDKTIERHIKGEHLETEVHKRKGDRTWLSEYWNSDEYYKNIPRLLINYS